MVLIGFLAFFVVSLAVGFRLLLLWRRTRQLPELLIGTGVLGIGPVGFGGMIAGAALWEAHAAAGYAVMALGTLAVYVGVTAKCVFNWHVYHRDALWAKWLTSTVGVVLAGIFLLRLTIVGFDPSSWLGPLAYITSLTQIGCLLWGSVEAIRYWGLMRRRASLGLADPVVTNRFFLWGLGAGAAGLGTAVGFVASVVTGLPSLQMPWVVAASSAHGFVAAAAMSLAFLPPQAYRDWIAGPAAESESA